MVDKPFRIVFFGTPDFAVPTLRALLAGPDSVVGVVCQPDKPAGRGQRLAVPPVKQLALEAGVPIFQPEKLRVPEAIAALTAWAPDLIVVAAYGKILPKSILDLPRLGCINVHGSILPKYRGAAPIQWAILRGEERTGVTIMRMNERMDAGDILLVAETDIGADETYGVLQTRLAELGAPALCEAVARLHAGTLVGQPQREEDMTLAPMIKKEDGRVDWRQPAMTLARMVRAFNPWPSAFTHLGTQQLKIHRAHADARTVNAPPGTVASLSAGVHVATGEGTLVLDEVQLEGRKRLPAAEFARGSIKVGVVLGGVP
ncbi:MAG: methionyl-tRNA formyltransferase [Deltaproteobacteria bacterium]|nr:methionyl-tRNA formyltransferase [Deltaproteobacteria bacterium]